MLNKKDNLIIFVLCLIVISLGVLIALKNPADVKIAKNKNVSIDKNLNTNQNTNQNKNINTNQQINKQTPENFVKEFYDYYFGPHNPVGISGFEFMKKGNYLSDSFLERIRGDKYRPYFFTCAQNDPISRKYENVTTTEDASFVLASHLYSTENQILVELKLKDNQWKIDDIQCLSVLLRSKYRTPKSFAKAFYNYYLSGYQRKFIAFEHIKNGGFLTDSFIKRIEGDSFKPYLLMCSHDVPINSEYDETKITDNTASVLAHHFYLNDKEVLVELKFKLKNDQWKIDDIKCLK